VSDRLVARRVHDGAAWITLNRPDARNALNLKMLADLRDALGWAADDESVRAVVLTGAGTVFCAGIDLAELDALHRLSVEEVRSRIYGSFQSIAEALVDMPKPVVAAVNGDALGAGLDIALACDIRIASRSARLSEYYVRVGLIPALSGTFLLPRLIGLGRSNLLSMTGDLVSGDEAFRLGLVDVVAEDADFLGAVADHAGRLAAGATVAIGLIKRATRHSWLRDMHAELEYAAGLQAEALQTADHMEAVTAIREQRKPRFTGH
jgi:enoyl-CoA hydratase/carnithine racemase